MTTRPIRSPPARDPDDLIRFVASHRPPLPSGEYTLTVGLKLTQDAAKRLGVQAEPAAAQAIPAAAGVELATRTARFVVAGERYALKKEDLHSCYPPPGSAGEYQGQLPHLIFDRSTLPWERKPVAGPDSDDSPPWLALLLFTGDDIPAVTTCRAGDLDVDQRDEAHKDGLWSARPGEVTQDAAEQVTCITVPWALLQTLAPRGSELEYMAHVRDVRRTDASSEVAVIIGNRLIESSMGASVRCAVHLVSLEHSYTGSGDTRTFSPVSGTPSPQAKVRLVSLYHWEFSSENEGSFLKTVERLDGLVGDVAPALRLPQRVTDARANELLSAGSVPLPHHIRQGDRTVSWYRGPLVPAVSPDGWLAQVPLPARCSDELLILDEDLGMFDASYAVAWEFGRLTALADRPFSVGLARWKRARARTAARLRVELDAAFLPHAHATADLADFPDELASFLARLTSLQGIPSSHLVPDARMLPEESLRFFDVDPMWVRCLLDGALSVGRVTAGDAARDADHLDHLPTPAAVSGFLLRSEVVTHYPKLAVAGYAVRPADPEANAWEREAHLDAEEYPPLPVLALRRLAPDLLLVLFDCEEPLDLIELHVPPEVLHFGLTSESGGYTRTLRDAGTGDEGETIDVDGDCLRGGDLRIVCFDVLAERIRAALPGSNPVPLHSGLFALQMLESAPCFRVRRGPPCEVSHG